VDDSPHPVVTYLTKAVVVVVVVDDDDDWHDVLPHARYNYSYPIEFVAAAVADVAAVIGMSSPLVVASKQYLRSNGCS